MKAVIVEIKGHHVAALTNEGCIIKVKNKNYAVGQVIEMEAQATRKQAKKPAQIMVWAASAAAAIVLVSVAAWAYLTPYTYVSLDVNPSIEYSVNRFNRVLSAVAVNGDGTEILQNLDLNNKTIDEAIKDTVDKIKNAGYFDGTDPGSIEISTSSDNQQDAENLAKELKSTAQQATEGNAAPIEVEAISVGHQRVLDAKALGTTPGKLNLVQKLQASMVDYDSFDVKEWLKKPVKTIMKAIKENKNAASSTKKGSNDTSSSAVNEANSQTDGSSASAVQQKGKFSSAQSSESKITGKTNNEKSGTAGNKNTNSQITSEPDTTSSEHAQSKTDKNANSNTNVNSKNQGNGNEKDKDKNKSK